MQQNSITGISLRLLNGTGPRFKLAGSKHVALYAATAVMYEYEKEQTVLPAYHHDWRSNSYLSCTFKPVENVEITGTFFYQPLFNEFSDYRILNEVNVKFKIVKHLTFTAGWYYLYDSKPAASSPKLNYSISNGIEYSF